MLGIGTLRMRAGMLVLYHIVAGSNLHWLVGYDCHVQAQMQTIIVGTLKRSVSQWTLSIQPRTSTMPATHALLGHNLQA